MDLTILDQNFVKKHIVDIYQSLIWTDRYHDAGDFELYIPLSNDSFDIFQNGSYIQMDESEHTMIIQDMSISTDAENGMFLTISGESLESILDRRIVWNQTIIAQNTYVNTAIKKLINDAIINPSIQNRRIENFIYEDTTDDRILSMKTEGALQFTGDSLYDAITKICEIYDLGFIITLNENGQFVFKLYAGVDRSYAQDTLPYVEFSPNFDNLISSDYKIVTSGYKNVTLVAGEGEGADRKTKSVYSDDFSGLNRRELYTDARDLSTNTSEGTISDSEYEQMLYNRGVSKLLETQVSSDFDANVNYSQPYEYGRDYFIGDVVQFQNELGISYRVQIMESIYSDSSNGIERYPTFKILEED